MQQLRSADQRALGTSRRCTVDRRIPLSNLGDLGDYSAPTTRRGPSAGAAVLPE